jgi:hypothetical protein
MVERRRENEALGLAPIRISKPSEKRSEAKNVTILERCPRIGRCKRKVTLTSASVAIPSSAAPAILTVIDRIDGFTI